MLRHQNIAAEQKPQPSPRSLQHSDQQRVIRFIESPEPGTKIDAEKEDPVRVAQPVDVGHARGLPSRPNAFQDPQRTQSLWLQLNRCLPPKEKPTVRKTLTLATRWLHFETEADSGLSLRRRFLTVTYPFLHVFSAPPLPAGVQLPQLTT
jgi:hypothetical protein